MKNYIILFVLFFSLFCQSQESVFDHLNKKGIGVFEGNGQLFFINQSTRLNDTNTFQEDSNTTDNNATSLAFTLNYESAKIKNFYVHLSYIQSIKFQEYSSISGNAAEITQNASFGILNNASINYNLKLLGLKKGVISVGRFPLNTEFMTKNKLRQKEQAFEGVLLDVPNIGNWNFTLGYLSKFSSWKSNPHEFTSIGNAYDSGKDSEDEQDLDYKQEQEFIEIGFKDEVANIAFNTYYIQANNLWSTVGISYLQKIASLGYDSSLSFKSKGIIQCNTGKNKIDEDIGGVQIGSLFTHNKLNVEGGMFLVTGKTIEEENLWKNPFGAKLILSEPLLGTSSSFTKGSESYYVESSYCFSKGKVYVLYLHTVDKQKNSTGIYDEIDLIASYNFNKRWSCSIKNAVLNQNVSGDNQHILDVRLVINYTF